MLLKFRNHRAKYLVFIASHLASLVIANPLAMVSIQEPANALRTKPPPIQKPVIANEHTLSKSLKNSIDTAYYSAYTSSCYAASSHILLMLLLLLLFILLLLLLVVYNALMEELLHHLNNYRAPVRKASNAERILIYLMIFVYFLCILYS